jgi:hypothetical protein
MDLMVEVSDEALEATCGGLMQGSPTLAFGSYCFTCRPHLHRGWLSTGGSSDREPMEVDMNVNPTFATGGFPQQTRFVLVNDRVPRTDRKCALCGNIVEKGYVRDARTRLIYCDTQCLPGRSDMTKSIINDCARKVS